MRACRIAVIAVSAACSAAPAPLPPAPQAVVWIDTDAPVPRLIDRMHVEVAAPGHPPCATCVHEFAFDTTTTWPLAFGVEQPDDGSARFVRVVLYPAGRVTNGEPQASTAIERIASIPFDGGVVAVRLLLSLDCAGRPATSTPAMTCVDGADPSRPVGDAPADDGAPSRVGSWHAELAHGCSSTTRDGEVCLSGGTYWMGDVRVQSIGGGHDGVPEHAVAVAPFFLDADLYTVGRYRGALARGFIPQAGEVGVRSGSAQSGNGCGYSEPPDPNDPLQDKRPLTCVSAAAAARLCALDGARLPSEAEHEWAAGSREHEWLYPWGNDDACGRLDVDCGAAASNASLFPRPVGANTYDVSIDAVRDLVGNGTQWLEDRYGAYDGPCWVPGEYGADPVCGPRPDLPALGFAARGQPVGARNNTPDTGYGAHMAAYRIALLDDGTAADISGVVFRCARDDAP